MHVTLLLYKRLTSAATGPLLSLTSALPRTYTYAYFLSCVLRITNNVFRVRRDEKI